MRKNISKIIKVFMLLFLVFTCMNFFRVNIEAADLKYDQKPMENIYNAKDHGEIRITGNTLQMPDKRYYNNALINSYGNTGAGGRGTSQNNDLYMGALDADTDSSTYNSSAADITLKPGDRIEKAFLVWGATVLPGDSKRSNGTTTGKLPQDPPIGADAAKVAAGPVIKFKTPKMSNYVEVAPTKRNQFNGYNRNDYTAYADVTELVKAGGVGQYWAGDIPASNGYDTYAGWSLVLVVMNDELPKNDLNVFFGHLLVYNNNPLEINLSGLKTPPAGTVHANVGLVVWEGDFVGIGDYATVGRTSSKTNPNKISDALTANNNIANSAVTNKGVVIKNRYPAYTNTHGMDAKVINLDGVVQNNQDTLGFYFESTGDIYYPTVVTTEVELYAPNLDVKKTVTNLTAQQRGDNVIREGDILEYKVSIKNISFDKGLSALGNDPLPAGVSYIPNSLVYKKTHGLLGVFTPLTDSKDGDIGEYNSNSNEIRVILGENSKTTEDNGGDFEYNYEEQYKYKVKVEKEGIGKAIINTFTVNYKNSDGESEPPKRGISKIIAQDPSYTFTKTADKEKLVAGETVTYTFKITNTGNVTLTNLGITDPLEGLSTPKLDKESVEPGEVATGTATYVVKQEDVDRGKLDNTATSTGTPKQIPGEEPFKPITHQASHSIKGEEHNPKFEFKKVADKQKLVVGETITYTFTVKNTGNVTLKNISISDPMPGLSTSSPKLDKDTLAPNETATAKATYVVKQEDVDKGFVENTATVTLTPPPTEENQPPVPLEGESSSRVPSEQDPKLEFSKKADKSELVAGETITYTFTVKNTGNVTIKELTLKDAMPGLSTSSPELSKTTLAPEESATASATYKVTQADVDKGVVKNSATVTGMPPQGPNGEPPKPITKEASVSVPSEHKPSIKLEKSADKEELVVGETITYTFKVKNTGNVTLNNVTLTDELEGLSTNSPELSKTTLAPNEEASASATYVVTQGDVDKGVVKNSATVTGTPPTKEGGEPPKPVTDTASVSVPSEHKPNIEFSKTADKTELVVDEVITYTFKVKNTGNVTLSNVSVTDPMEGLSPIVLEKDTLAPGESVEAKATYTVTQADVDRGVVKNTATVTGTPPTKEGGTPPAPITKTSTVSVPSEHEPKLEFSKKANKSKAKLGEEITYTFTVKNTGNVTLSDISIEDAMEGLSPIVLEKNTLAPGESTEAKATYTVKQSDVDKGELENTATVTGTPPTKEGGTPPPPLTETSTVTIKIDNKPGLEFIKVADKKELVVDEVITYTFTVKNTGNVTLSNITLTDEMEGLSTPVLEKDTLEPGESTKASAQYTVTQADVDRGVVKNSAKVTATPPTKPSDPNPIPLEEESSVSVPSEHDPKIEFSKVADKSELVAGETITYTFTVKNTGNVTLSNITLTDPMEGLTTPVLEKDTLAPNESTTASATYEVTQADVDRGVVKNSATVTAMPPTKEGEQPPKPLTKESSVSVPSEHKPSIKLEKSADKSELVAGETITYTFKVKNTGNVTLSGIVLSDPMPGLSTSKPVLDKDTLAPNEEATATATYEVTQADVNKGIVKNTATVTGTPPTKEGGTPPQPVTDNSSVSVPSEHRPSFEFKKTTDKEEDYRFKVGDVITYKFTVKNTGNVTLSNIKLSDPMPGLSKPVLDKTTLEPGESASASAQYTVTQSDVNKGKIINVAHIEVTPPTREGGEPPVPIPGEDKVILLGEEHKPDLEFKKSNDKKELVVGETINYTFVVKNTGNVTLTNVTLNDPMPGLSKVVLGKDKLEPGESTEAKGTYKVTQADVNRGIVKNTATVTAMPPQVEGEEPPRPLTRKDSTEVKAVHKPSFEFKKEVLNKKVVYAGEEVEYKFTIKNTGNVTLSNVTLTDPMPGLSTPVLDKTTLEPGESATATAKYTLKQEDVNRGSLENTAKVTLVPPTREGEQPPAPLTEEKTKRIEIEKKPDYTFVKSANKKYEEQLQMGEEVVYTFTIKNTGNVTLTNIKIDDPMEGISTHNPVLDKTTLEPGESATATATYVVTKRDVYKEEFGNHATSSATPPKVGGKESEPIIRRSSVVLRAGLLVIMPPTPTTPNEPGNIPNIPNEPEGNEPGVPNKHLPNTGAESGMMTMSGILVGIGMAIIVKRRNTR